MLLKPGLMLASLLGLCTLGGCGQKGPLTLPPVKPVPAAAPVRPATRIAPPPVSPALVAPAAAATSSAPPVPADATSSG